MDGKGGPLYQKLEAKMVRIEERLCPVLLQGRYGSRTKGHNKIKALYYRTQDGIQG